jgi:hypothetical protein
MLENQQVRIQWFTKVGDKLPKRTSHQSPGKEANKLKLANNGYVRNHKLLGSQPNTKQKSRQVDVLGIDWSRKHKSISNQDAKTHEYHAAQQIFKRNNNNKGPTRNICNSAWRLQTEEKTAYHKKVHPEQPPIQLANINLKVVALMKVQYHVK